MPMVPYNPPAATAEPEVPETPTVGTDPVADAMSYMQTQYGWSPAAAAGIVGNLSHESGMKTTALGDGGQSFGLAQWNGDRRKALADFATKQNKPIDDPYVQLDFINHELAENHSHVIDALMNADNPAAAAQVFSKGFERPGKPMMDSRAAAANRAFELADKIAGPAPAAAEVGAARKLRPYKMKPYTPPTASETVTKMGEDLFNAIPGTEERKSSLEKGWQSGWSHFYGDFLGNLVDLFGKAADVMGEGAATAHGFSIAPSKVAEDISKPVSDYLRGVAEKVAPKGKGSDTLQGKIFEGLGGAPAAFTKYALAIAGLGPVAGMAAADAVSAADKGSIPAIKAAVEGAALGTGFWAAEPLKVLPKVVALGSLGAMQAKIDGGDAKDIAAGAATMALLGMSASGGNLSAKEALSDSWGQFQKKYDKMSGKEKEDLHSWVEKDTSLEDRLAEAKEKYEADRAAAAREEMTPAQKAPAPSPEDVEAEFGRIKEEYLAGKEQPIISEVLPPEVAEQLRQTGEVPPDYEDRIKRALVGDRTYPASFAWEQHGFPPGGGIKTPRTMASGFDITPPPPIQGSIPDYKAAGIRDEAALISEQQAFVERNRGLLDWYDKVKALRGADAADELLRIHFAEQGKDLAGVQVSTAVDAAAVDKTVQLVKDSAAAESLKDEGVSPMYSGGPDTAEWLKNMAPVWYSRMQNFLGEKLPGKGTGHGLANTVEGWAGKGQFKGDELKWSGLVPWLREQKGPVTKQQVLDFLKENQVEVREVERSGFKGLTSQEKQRLEYLRDYEQAKGLDRNQRAELDDLENRSTEKTEPKFQSYMQLPPGGENYREALLGVSGEPKYGKVKIVPSSDYEGEWDVVSPGGGHIFFSGNTKAEAEEYIKGMPQKNAFRVPSAHSYNDPAADVNRFAHIFMDDRVIDGKKYLTVWELQSDWAQKGRREGYKDINAHQRIEYLRNQREQILAGDEEFKKYQEIATLSKLSQMEAESAYNKMGGHGEERTAAYEKYKTALKNADNANSEWQKIKGAYANRQRELVGDIDREIMELKTSSSVPPFPFSKNWMEVSLKKVLRKAAEEGYDGVAWASGDMVKGRYDLSKRLSKIEYSPEEQDLLGYDHSGNQVIDKAGVKPEQLAEYVGKDVADRLLKAEQTESNNVKYHTLEGEDIKVGGEWANRQYDQMMPQFLDKYGKQWGAKVGEADIEVEKGLPMGAGDEPIHTLPITPAMKKSVLQTGQPLFSGGPDTSQWFKDVWNSIKESRQTSGSAIGLEDMMKKASSVWGALRGEPKPWTDYKSLINKYLGDRQIAGLDNYRMLQRIQKAVPDKVKQEALTNWIEAGGDDATLRGRYEATKDERLKKGYETALNLTPEEKAIGQEVIGYFDKMLKEGQEAGVLDSAVENYINHIWKKDSPTAQRLRAEVNAGLFNTNFSYARKRLWSTYFEGEQAGKTPKNKSVAYLLGRYHQSFYEAIAAREAIRSMLDGAASDGLPLVTTVGGASTIGRPQEESRAFADVPPDYDMTGKSVGPQAYLVKPRKITEEQKNNYRPIDHPALRKWKWVGNDWDGKPMLLQGDMWVHKEAYNHLKNVLSKSKIREHPVGRAVLAGVQSLKSTLLMASGFHQVQIGLHATFHKVNPFTAPPIDFKDPVQRELVQHGLMVYDHNGLADFSEGLYSSGLASKIPFAGAMLDKYGRYLFQDLIPRYKMKLGTEALGRNIERYGHKYDRDQILELTANQSNAAFGELNYKSMGRSQTMQDAFRLLCLAPDFLEARARFVGQAARPGGKEQFAALLRGAIGLYAVGVIGNMLFSDDKKPHWNKPFTLTIGGKDYALRSVPGDLIHLVRDPRNFSYWRLNPTTVRTMVEYFTGRDAYGRKRNMQQQVQDFFTAHTPIPVQGLMPSAKREENIVESALRSIGVSSYKHHTDAEQMMLDYFTEYRVDRPATSELVALQKARRKVTDLARSGKEDEAITEARGAVGKYGLDPEKAVTWLMESRSPEKVVNFQRLPLEVAAKVMNAADEEEKKAFMPILLDKIGNASTRRLEAAMPELQKLLGEKEKEGEKTPRQGGKKLKRYRGFSIRGEVRQ